MKLDAYLTKEGIKTVEFAKQINRSLATASRLRRGINRPDWATMDAIHKVTGGAVTPLDFMEDGEAA